MQLYRPSQVEMFAAKARVILPSLYAPFGLPQPIATVVAKQALVPPQGVRGWPSGEAVVARAWRQAAPSGYCGHLVVACVCECVVEAWLLGLLRLWLLLLPLLLLLLLLPLHASSRAV